MTAPHPGVREVQSTFTIILEKLGYSKRFPLQVIPPGVGPGGLAALLLLDEHPLRGYASRLRGMKMSLPIAWQGRACRWMARRGAGG